MAEVPAALEKQIGPFPVYGWLAIVGAGVGVGLVLRRTSLFGGKSSKAATVTASGAEGPSGAIIPTGGAPVNRAPIVNTPGPGAGPGATPGSTSPTTNQEWAKQAVDYLIGAGIAPIVATSAITKYLDGAALDFAQQQALSMALKSLGTPPEFIPTPVADQGVPTPVGRANPVTPPPPASDLPRGLTRKVIVRPTDGDIAQFVTDYETIEWIPSSHEAKALALDGAINAGYDGAGWPIPLGVERGQVNAMKKKGPPPNYGGAESPVKTTW